MTVRISSELRAAILADVAVDASVERCGLLLGAGGKITAFCPLPNVSPIPARAFEIDPAGLIAAHRRARAGGPRIIGHYHSHPSGRAEPSATDAAASAGDDALWLIVAGEQIGAWRAVAGGSVLGAFEAVRLG